MMSHLGLVLLGLLSTIGSPDGASEAPSPVAECAYEAAYTEFLTALDAILAPLGSAPMGLLDDEAFHALLQGLSVFPAVLPAEHLAMHPLLERQLPTASNQFASDLSSICLLTYLRGSRLAIATVRERPELRPELRQHLSALLQTHAQAAFMAPVALPSLRTHTILMLQAARTGLLPHVSIALLEAVQDSLQRAAADCPAGSASGPACTLERSEPARLAMSALLAQKR